VKVPLVPGLYEALVTDRLDAALATLEAQGLRIDRHKLDSAESHLVIARHLWQLLVTALRGVSGDGPERIMAQVGLANAVLGLIGDAAGLGTEDAIAQVATELHAVLPPAMALGGKAPARPGIPLSASNLLINARDEHRVGAEVAKELESADQADLLCSFVKWSGLRLLREPLEQVTARGRRLRVLTTTYMGATDRHALDHLVNLGAEVRVSYNTQRTRLHAKAWLFRRNSGFDTAYIGSSNLSAAALSDGREWNVRLSRIETPGVVEKFAATFDSYWEDAEFEPYDPAKDADRFDEAREDERGKEVFINFAFVDVRPFPHQSELLQKLDAERKLHDRRRNLVVAATGTGKTIVAALDYKRFREGRPRASLLFVAHRREILEQSLRAFRTVLRYGALGELWVDGRRPTNGSIVFASVQSLANTDLASLPPDAFDMVIVDEFHHAAAPTYARLLDHLKPEILLGLTATPERADGQSVLGWFEGRIAAELRLWDALERNLLSPFQCFGLNDEVDISQVRWNRGRYETEALEKIYTGHDARVRLVLQALRDKVVETGKMRALGFCVGVSHAEYMARKFNEAGIPARAVSGETSSEARDEALRLLRDRKLNVLFAVDLFNEGVDVPEIDTVLFLRPTESPTIFLQQLGRGLRLAPGKDCLTVLDFIGQSHQNFRFDLRFSALAGGTRHEVAKRIEAGFPVLPSGCAIALDRVAQRTVLDNIRAALKLGRKGMVADLISCGPGITLYEYLRRTNLSLGELYRARGDSWSDFKRRAGFPMAPEGPDEGRLRRGLARCMHFDDIDRIRAYRTYIKTREGADPRLLEMLHFSLWGVGSGAPIDLDDSLRRLWACPEILRELEELLAVLEDQVDHLAHPLDLDVPLKVHCHYTLAEVQVAFGKLPLDRPYLKREGVLWDPATKSELMFVTLDKAESDYSPRTMYNDYAISPQLFHWESQNRTSASSPTGTRYLTHEQNGIKMLLFVRKRKVDDRGISEPYFFAGPARYVSHQGERPMAITWRLDHEIPAEFFREFKLVA
jgi:superfamily II DNA or RNA helicase/HKD family nuclease